MEYSDKKIQILESAEKLIASKGFAATSVRDIAQDAGVNIAMISYYFGSKEKLLHEIFEWRAAHTLMQLKDISYSDDLTPMQKIEKLIDAFVKRATSQQCFHRIFMREQMIDRENELTQKILAFKKQNLGFIKALIKEGQDKGVFKKKVDVGLMMTTMNGTVQQIISTQHHYREMNNMTNLSDEAFQKYMNKKLSIHLKSLFKAMLTYEL